MSKTEFEGALIRTIIDHAVAQHNTGDKAPELVCALERAEAAEHKCAELQSRCDKLACLADSRDGSMKALLERAEAAEQERDESEGAFKVWRRRCNEADRVLDDLEQWTHEFGAHLCPPGADTYGEGVRDCKQQVADILHKVLK